MNVKLWRLFNTFLENQELSCASCITAEYKEKGLDCVFVKNANKQEKWSNPNKNASESDTIGIYLPAVPTEKNDCFWAYSSVPFRGGAWWKKLATGY